MILWVVSPVDHRLLVAEEELKITLSPSQKVVAPAAEIIGLAGAAFTVTEVSAETGEAQVPLKVVTEKTPELRTVMLLVVAPLDHW